MLVGVSGSGKSTFARAHFTATEVISSDFCRGLVADDENDQSATADAFDVLHYIAGKRLAAGGSPWSTRPTCSRTRASRWSSWPARTTSSRSRSCWTSRKACASMRNAGRPDRDFGPHVIRRQHADLRRSVKGLRREGFRTVHVLRTEAEIAQASIRRTKMFSDLRHVSGPFDVIGDVHGCREELEAAAGRARLRPATGTGRAAPSTRRHPAAGASSSSVTWSTAARTPLACCGWRWAWWRRAPRSAVAGNHEVKLLRALRAGLGGGPGR